MAPPPGCPAHPADSAHGWVSPNACRMRCRRPWARSCPPKKSVPSIRVVSVVQSKKQLLGKTGRVLRPRVPPGAHHLGIWVVEYGKHVQVQNLQQMLVKLGFFTPSQFYKFQALVPSLGPRNESFIIFKNRVVLENTQLRAGDIPNKTKTNKKK